MSAARLLLAVALVAAAPGVARADPPPAPPPAEEEAPPTAKRVQLTLRLGTRFTSSAPYSHQYQDVLEAYGYGSLSSLLEGNVDVGFSLVRWLDLGVHAGYLFGTAGSSGATGSLLALHALEVGGFAYALFGRTEARRTGGFGFGVEGGMELPWLVLRGEATSARVPYVAPVLLLRLNAISGVETAIHLRYVVSDWANAFGRFGLPLGGVSIGIGANLSR